MSLLDRMLLFLIHAFLVEKASAILYKDPCKTSHATHTLRSVCHKTYLFDRTKLGFYEAEEQCKLRGGFLARPKTFDELKYILDVYTKFVDDGRAHFYVGAMSETIKNTYRWRDRTLVLNSVIGIGWMFFLRDNGRKAIGITAFMLRMDPSVKHYCLFLDGATKLLITGSCKLQTHFVCEMCFTLSPIQYECESLCLCTGSGNNTYRGRPYCKFSYPYCENPECYAVGGAGQLCNTLPCERSRWGLHCQNQCYCYDSVPCGLEDGHCPEGGYCMENWEGPACNLTKCPLHRYGDHCEHDCLCADDQQCSIEGTCLTGCKSGTVGISCNISKSCKVGSYGEGCELACNCLPYTHCDAVDGTCLAAKRCLNEYWHGPACNLTMCPKGKFKAVGPYCDGICACSKGQQCDYLTGWCFTECYEGWKGKSCNETYCDLGYWGSNCQNVCTCYLHGEQVPCSSTTGECPLDSFMSSWPACEMPWKWGPHCEHDCEAANCVVCERERGDYCRECELGYYEQLGPHKCTIACLPEQYGKNCSRECPKSCPFNCDDRYGRCKEFHFVQTVFYGVFKFILFVLSVIFILIICTMINGKEEESLTEIREREAEEIRTFLKKASVAPHSKVDVGTSIDDLEDVARRNAVLEVGRYHSELSISSGEEETGDWVEKLKSWIN